MAVRRGSSVSNGHKSLQGVVEENSASPSTALSPRSVNRSSNSGGNAAASSFLSIQGASSVSMAMSSRSSSISSTSQAVGPQQRNGSKLPQPPASRPSSSQQPPIETQPPSGTSSVASKLRNLVRRVSCEQQQGGPTSASRTSATSARANTTESSRQASSSTSSKTKVKVKKTDTQEEEEEQDGAVDVVMDTPPSTSLDDNDPTPVTNDDEDADEDEEGTAEQVAQRQRQQEEADVAFTTKLVGDEPIRKPPEVQIRPLIPNQVWLSVTPFAHRQHTIVFPPADSPWEGDPQASASSAYVTPSSIDHVPFIPGQRRRIGRKNKYADLVYSIPEGSVRFSSVLAIFGTAGFREADEDDIEQNRWSIRWTKRVEPEDYKALLPLQRVNHIPGTWGIGRKDNLHRHLNKYMAKYGVRDYNFHPPAWLLPQDHSALARDMAAKECCPPGMKRNVYIVKQVASACGRRMRLLSSGSIPKGTWLVQRYIHDPLLIYGYEFDLRIYVVVTSYLPLKVYVYEEGLVRFATTPYPKPTEGKRGSMRVKSVTAHLTNYSVNKNNTDAFVNPTDDGVDEEKGSKWVLSTVKRHFEQRGLDWSGCWAKIEDLIIKTLLSVEQDVVQQLRGYQGTRPEGYNNCFELYGFDVLLRENLMPVLMEVNIMPSLSTRCSLLDQRVKANMIADMLTLVGAYSLDKGKPKKPKPGALPAMHAFFSSISAYETEAVCQAEEENNRRCHFKRLFPTATAHDTYKHLFQEVKPLNAMLCAWEKAKVLSPPSWTAMPVASESNVSVSRAPRQTAASKTTLLTSSARRQSLALSCEGDDDEDDEEDDA